MDNDQATLTSQEVDTTVDSKEPELNQRDVMAEKLAEIRSRNADDSDGKTSAVVKADKPRDDKGKFAKTADDAPIKAEVTIPDQKQADAPDAAPVIKIDPSIQPPTSYTPEGKAEFIKASPAIQKEILKRESDFHRYYKEVEPLKQAAAYGQEIYKAIQPFEQTIRNWNATPAQAIQALFSADQKLTHGSPAEKLQAFANLAKGYGIDLSQGLPEQQQVDPNVEYLQRQNHRAMQTAQAAQQEIQQMKDEFARQQQAAEQAQLNSAIEQAKQGKPHFDELRTEIGMILQSAINKGHQITMEEAYEAAMWQSPKHRAELLAKQQADAEAVAAQKRANDAEKAKAARQASSVNVQKRGTLQSQAPVGDTKDYMREKLAEIRSR